MIEIMITFREFHLIGILKKLFLNILFKIIIFQSYLNGTFAKNKIKNEMFKYIKFNLNQFIVSTLLNFIILFINLY